MKSLIKLPITIGTVPLYSTYRCVHFEDSVESNHIGKCVENHSHNCEIENKFFRACNLFSFSFFSLVPFKYEALLQDYLDLGSASDDKNSHYAPVYPIFTARPSKRRQLSEQSLESASERSTSEQSLNDEQNDESSNEWNEWSSGEFDGLVIGDTD